MLKESICLSCKKLELARIPGLSIPIFFCSAFPEGVPSEISGGLYDHREQLGDETELWEFNDKEEQFAKSVLGIYEQLKKYQDKTNPNAKEEAQKSYAEREKPYKGMTREQILEALTQEFFEPSEERTSKRDVSSKPEPHVPASNEDPEEDKWEGRRLSRRLQRDLKKQQRDLKKEEKKRKRELNQAEFRRIMGQYFQDVLQRFLEDRAFKKLPPEVQRDMIRRARKAEDKN